jgi:mRNA interferase RelE/StbE
MIYSLEVHKEAHKAIERLDKTTIRRLFERLRELVLAPYDPRLSKPLRMAEGQRSSRVGDWRIIFWVNEEKKLIEVLSVYPRGKAYK